MQCVSGAFDAILLSMCRLFAYTPVVSVKYSELLLKV